jgi:mono/diheme cytochrome c family protein
MSGYTVGMSNIECMISNAKCGISYVKRGIFNVNCPALHVKKCAIEFRCTLRGNFAGWVNRGNAESVAVSSHQMFSRLHFNPFRPDRQARPFWVGALVVSLASASGLLSGCKPLPPSKAAAEFTPQEARGALVFQADCARCHYPTTTKGLKGPGLQALTKVKAMPSGAPPSDERILSTILHGHGMMPAVPVGDGDIDSLLAYLHTL